MKISAIVFDLDDTLYPEYEYVQFGFEAVADRLESKFGIKSAKSEMSRLFVKDKKNVYGRLLDEKGVKYADEDIAELADVYRNHIPKLSLSQTVKDTLEQLREEGYGLGIITDGRPFQQRAKIGALGVDRLVDEIIVTDELGGVEFRKPNPLAFEIMARRLSVRIDEMLYVGDNPNKDFAVKAYLPITAVQLKSHGIYKECDYLDGIMPDATIDKIEDIIKYIEAIEK